MTPEGAIDIVAHRVLADLAKDVQDAWDGYPEIGEDDWRAVMKRVLILATALRPVGLSLSVAYDLLESRAENDG